MTDITQFVHKLSSWKREKGYTLNPEHCVYRVSAQTRFEQSHQCTRKPTETIEGYSFCTQHSRQVKQSLGLSKSERTIYVAQFSSRYDEPSIWKMQVERETAKMFYILSKETVFGTSGYYRLTLKKSGEDGHHSFDTLDQAIEWIIKEIKRHIQFLESKKDTCIHNITTLRTMMK